MSTKSDLKRAPELTLHGFRISDICRDFAKCLALTDNDSKQRVCYLIVELTLSSSSLTTLIRIIDSIIQASMKQCYIKDTPCNPWLLRVATCILNLTSARDSTVSLCEAALAVMMQPSRQIPVEAPRPSLDLLHLVTLNSSSSSLMSSLTSPTNNSNLKVLLGRVVTPEPRRLFGALVGAVLAKDAKSATSIATLILQPLNVSPQDFGPSGQDLTQMHDPIEPKKEIQVQPVIGYLWKLAHALVPIVKPMSTIEAFSTMYCAAWTKKSAESRSGIIISAYGHLCQDSQDSQDLTRLDRVMCQIRDNMDTIVQDIRTTSSTLTSGASSSGSKKARKPAAAKPTLNMDYLKYYTTTTTCVESCV